MWNINISCFSLNEFRHNCCGSLEAIAYTKYKCPYVAPPFPLKYFLIRFVHGIENFSISFGISAVTVLCLQSLVVTRRTFSRAASSTAHHTITVISRIWSGVLIPCGLWTYALFHSSRTKATPRSQRRISRRPRDCTLKRSPSLGRYRYHVHHPEN